MKKKVFGGVMLLVAAMVFSVGGTCFAQDTVYIDTTLSGSTRVFHGPVFSWAEDRRAGIGTGATAYGVISDPFNTFTDSGVGGATPFAIARDIKDNAGNLRIAWAPDRYAPHFSGATAVGSPAVISGKTSAFVVVVQAPSANAVRHFDRASLGTTGVTVVMFDGARMTANWARGIPEATAGIGPQMWNEANPYFPTELTIWKPRSGSRLDDTGVTIYGTSGAEPAQNLTGASVWALTNWGAIAGGGTWDEGRGTTAWPVDTRSYSFTGSNNTIRVKNAAGANLGTVSAVSGFVTAPVISGNSVFYIGYSQARGGITVYQLHKDALNRGVINAATVNLNASWSQRFMPTPAVVETRRSGASLFVVDNMGGVTVYDTQDLTFGAGRTQGNLGRILLPFPYTTGVTASPVVYSSGQGENPYIIMCGTSAVTAFRLSDISDGDRPKARQWWYDFAANHGAGNVIFGTPAVAANYVFVPVNDTVSGDGRIFAFKISDAPNMANGQLRFARQFDMNAGAVGSPIVVNRELWAFSFGNSPGTSARSYKWNVNNLLSSDNMRAHRYWTQFKFDAGKTGDATVRLDKDVWHDDSSGCFLSTIK